MVKKEKFKKVVCDYCGKIINTKKTYYQNSYYNFLCQNCYKDIMSRINCD